MMDADLSPSEAADGLLSHVSASAIEAVCLLMIDSLDLETLMMVDPRRSFVGVNDRTLGKRGADERSSVAFHIDTAGTDLSRAPGSP